MRKVYQPACRKLKKMSRVYPNKQPDILILNRFNFTLFAG